MGPLIRPVGHLLPPKEAREGQDNPDSEPDLVAFSRFFLREKVPKGDEGPFTIALL